MAKRVDVKSSHHKEKSYDREMMDAMSTYCSNHFAIYSYIFGIYIHQIMMLYTLAYTILCINYSSIKLEKYTKTANISKRIKEKVNNAHF